MPSGHRHERRTQRTRAAARDRGAVCPLAKLESEIAARGYRRIYLMTGDRQPEAEALYLSLGYTRLDEPLASEGEVYPVVFEKRLT
jgi:hypothetical protein